MNSISNAVPNTNIARPATEIPSHMRTAMTPTKRLGGRDPGIPSADGTCHILRIPRELRDHIYTLSSTNRTIHLSSVYDSREKKQNRQESDFLLTNRQLRSECLESLLKNCTFKAHDQPALLKFLNTIPDTLRASIKNIHCTYEIYCPPWNAQIDTRERPWVYYRGLSGGLHFEQHQLRNNRNVAVWELVKLERFRRELAAKGIVLKSGVLKAEVRADGVNLEWAWKH